MLKGTIATSMNFNSVIDGKLTVYMSAQIPENGSANTSIAVQDRELYEANKAECRKDIEEFNKLVYAMEDKRVTETKGVNEDEAEE